MAWRQAGGDTHSRAWIPQSSQMTGLLRGPGCRTTIALMSRPSYVVPSFCLANNISIYVCFCQLQVRSGHLAMRRGWREMREVSRASISSRLW
jgi:hypothetical protein